MAGSRIVKIKDAKSYENCGGTAVQNIEVIRECIHASFMTSDKWSLLSENRKLFKKLWGKQNFCWTGEFRFWVWVHELPDCQLIVMTAPGKGTCYEYVLTGQKQKAIEQIVEFLIGLTFKGIEK